MRIDPNACVRDEEYQNPLLTQDGFWENRQKLSLKESQKRLKALNLQNESALKTLEKADIIKEYVKLAKTIAGEFTREKQDREKIEKFRKFDADQAHEFFKNSTT